MHSGNRNLVTPWLDWDFGYQISTPLAPLAPFHYHQQTMSWKTWPAISGVGIFFQHFIVTAFSARNHDWSPWFPLAAFAHESYARFAPSAFTVKRSGGWERCDPWQRGRSVVISDQQRAGKKLLANIKHTLKFNKAPKKLQLHKENSFPTIIFQGLCQFSGVDFLLDKGSACYISLLERSRKDGRLSSIAARR